MFPALHVCQHVILQACDLAELALVVWRHSLAGAAVLPYELETCRHNKTSELEQGDVSRGHLLSWVFGSPMMGSVMPLSCLVREGMVWMVPPLEVNTRTGTRKSVENTHTHWTSRLELEHDPDPVWQQSHMTFHLTTIG